MNLTKSILFNEVSGKESIVGVVTLNRPQVLNALDHDMVKSLFAQLQTWMTDTRIKAVVIKAEGRAFCAGGDLRAMVEGPKTKKVSLANFFYDEYQLNRLIFHYPKPYIALWDGVTMGGGVGISINGSHRVATEKLTFAMPETGIGFFPDVGGTFFLPRLAGKIGYYLGLAGVRINSDDCVALGIAQHKVSSETLAQIVPMLADANLVDEPHKKVTSLLQQLSICPEASSLLIKKPLIDRYFLGSHVQTIVHALGTSTDAGAKEIADILLTKSPLSLAVTLRALEEGKQLDFDDCMRQEYRLASRFIEGHDFFEGIRAQIIDKDKNPHWIPASLDEITYAEVDKYFAPLLSELALPQL